jgi:hypothetical protein
MMFTSFFNIFTKSGLERKLQFSTSFSINFFCYYGPRKHWSCSINFLTISLILQHGLWAFRHAKLWHLHLQVCSCEFIELKAENLTFTYIHIKFELCTYFINRYVYIGTIYSNYFGNWVNWIHIHKVHKIDREQKDISLNFKLGHHIQ